jgi:hypothetical protein
MNNDLIALQGTPVLGSTSPVRWVLLGLGAAALAFLAASVLSGGKR